MYGRGMTTREIRGHVEELYGISVSAELISKVTDAVHEEVREWRMRSLEQVYSVVYLDAMRVKIRDEGMVRNRALYLGIGITPRGEKEVLGMWIEQTEGAGFWLGVLNEMKNRGVEDILIAVVDGLSGFSEANREPEQHGAASGDGAGALSERPCGDEVDLPGAAGGGAKVEAGAVAVACGAERVCDPIRRPLPVGGGMTVVRAVGPGVRAERCRRQPVPRPPAPGSAAGGRLRSRRPIFRPARSPRNRVWGARSCRKT